MPLDAARKAHSNDVVSPTTHAQKTANERDGRTGVLVTSVQFNSKTLIIPQGAILLWSWRAHKKYVKLREQYNKQKSLTLTICVEMRFTVWYLLLFEIWSKRQEKNPLNYSKMWCDDQTTSALILHAPQTPTPVLSPRSAFSMASIFLLSRWSFSSLFFS